MGKTATSSTTPTTIDLNNFDDIAKAIDTILDSDPQASAQTEALLSLTMEKNPSEYVKVIAKVLQDTPKLATRVFCIAHLRRLISVFLQHDEEEKWVKLGSDAQKFIKDTLVQMLKETKYLGSKSVFRDLIIDIVCTIQAAASRGNKRMSKEATEWNELKQVIWELLGSEDTIAIESSLAILSGIIENESALYAKSDKQLVEVLKKLGKSGSDGKIRLRAIGTLVMYIERFPKKFSKKTDLIKEIGELIFDCMVSTAEEPDADWINPPDNFTESYIKNDPSSRNINLGMAIIDHILAALPEDHIIKIFQELIINKLKNNNDWKHQHCGLMALCQVAEFIEGLSGFDATIMFIAQALQHEHPKVRYAALHCLGQYAEDARPRFQVTYGGFFMPLLVKMYSDNILRVVYHAVNCTVNFIEGSPKELILHYLPYILESMLKFVEKGKYALKENALAAIANMADMCGSAFRPFWMKTYETIFGELNKIPDDVKNMKGQAIEAITLIAGAVGRSEFVKVASTVIEKMTEIQVMQVMQAGSQKLDDLSFYLVAAWARLCNVLKEDFGPFIATVMPWVFKMIQIMFQVQRDNEKLLIGDETELSVVAKFVGNGQHPAREKDEFEEVLNIEGTPESEDLSVVLLMLRNFFACGFRLEHVKYVEMSIEIAVSLLSNHYEDSIKRTVAFLLDIIEEIDKSSYEDKQSVVKSIYDSWLQKLYSIDLFSSQSVLAGYMKVMTLLVRKVGKTMTDTEFAKFYDMILKIFVASQKRLLDTKDGDNEEGEEDQEEEDGEDDEIAPYKLEDRLQTAIAQLIGALFKVYKEESMPLVKTINSEILPMSLFDNIPTSLTKFALLMIDNMIEFLGVELMHEQMAHFTEVLITFTTNPKAMLRYPAAYGLGVLSQIGYEGFKDISEACLNALYESLKMPREEDEDEEEWSGAAEVSVCAIGKIIRSQHHNIDMKKAVQVWLTHLPLHSRADGRKIENGILVDMLMGPDAALVLGENGEGLKKAVEVMVTELGTKYVNDDFVEKVSNVIGFLVGQEKTRDWLQKVISVLDKPSQDKLKKVVMSNCDVLNFVIESIQQKTPTLF